MKFQSCVFLFFGLIFLSPLAHGQEHQRFDGQFYNNLYYPRIDILEWGEPSHLQFQIYEKKKKIDVSGVTVGNGVANSFLVAFDFTFRGERLCRRVPAPMTFKPGKKLFHYYDNSDKDMNNIIISANPLEGYKAYTPAKFTQCIEVAATPPSSDGVIANEPRAQPRKEKEPLTRAPASGDGQGPTTIFEENAKIKDPKDGFKYEPIANDYDLFTDREASPKKK